MPARISLNGEDWLFKSYMGEDWVWRNAHKPDTRDVRHWLSGTVPGSVHNDLWHCREIPNPYFERNTLLMEWIPDRTWLYKKTFTVSEEHRGQRIRLCFEGVDYEAQFFLNGERLGEHCGMYTPAIFEVSDLLQYGADNVLVVVIEPAPHEQPQVGRTSKVRTHKSRMTYWWDFCPRMVHLGIWDSVYLAVTGAAAIEDVFVRPQLAEGLNHADLALAIGLSTSEVKNVEVEITIRLGEEIVAKHCDSYTLRAGRTRLDASLEVKQPQLWWPNGYGEQALYQAEVRVMEAETSAVSDARQVTFGIRRVEFVRNETPDDTARPYTAVVNGRKIYLKGWNWAPMDVMYGVERPEKLKRLLTLAQRAHVNLLRVWGGGLIEKEAFYDLCDQYGIMVWQEFIQSSSGIDNDPPRDTQFIEMLVDEAEQIIPRKRNHPSLVIWCGGNELQSVAQQPLDDSHSALAALRDVVERLDPGRMWLPTSPTGPVFMNSLENVERDLLSLHDVHGPWEHQGLMGQYSLYNRTTSLLHSEFGAEGITNLCTLKHVMAEENRWPVTLDSPVWEHLGAWWVKERQWRESLGEVRDLETLVHGTQFLQAEAVRYAIEANRRRKYQNSGTLPWQFNEPYPMAACTSAVDYYGQPKPLYYAVAHAYEPVHVSAKFESQTWAGKTRFEAEIWASNSREESFSDVQLEVRLIGAGGNVYAEQRMAIALDANRATKLTVFEADLADVETVFLLDVTLRMAGFDSDNTYLFTRSENLAAALATPQTTLQVEREASEDDWCLKLTNSGDSIAFYVWLEGGNEPGSEGYLYVDNNCFCLAPGESTDVHVHWHNVIASGRRLHIAGWNTPEAVIR